MINDELMRWARSYTGLVETPGAASEPVLLEMARILDLGHFTDDTRQNWCGLFVAFIAAMCACPLPGNPTIARNWMTQGAPVLQPIPGDIVVLRAEDPASLDGHVAFFESMDQTGPWVWLFGGNQVDGVRSFRYDKSRILAIRRLFR